MSIYMFHTIATGPTKFLFMHIMNLNPTLFLLSALIGCFSGILIPIFIDKYVLRPYSLTSKLFLGLTPHTD